MNDTKERFELIGSICDRALGGRPNGFCQKLDLCMDIDFADQDIPLDLQKLLDFPDGDFFHDVNGIVRHMNRETKKLGDCFMPRCAS